MTTQSTSSVHNRPRAVASKFETTLALVLTSGDNLHLPKKMLPAMALDASTRKVPIFLAPQFMQRSFHFSHMDNSLSTRYIIRPNDNVPCCTSLFVGWRKHTAVVPFQLSELSARSKLRFSYGVATTLTSIFIIHGQLVTAQVLCHNISSSSDWISDPTLEFSLLSHYSEPEFPPPSFANLPRKRHRTAIWFPCNMM